MKYPGVCRLSRSQRCFQASASVNGRRKYIGSYTSQLAASCARDFYLMDAGAKKSRLIFGGKPPMC